MCKYCGRKKTGDEHFECVNCGEGMCDECYNKGVEHDLHMFDFQESIEDNDFYEFIKNKTGFNYGYLCFDCYDILEEEFNEQNNFEVICRDCGSIRSKNYLGSVCDECKRGIYVKNIFK